MTWREVCMLCAYNRIDSVIGLKISGSATESLAGFRQALLVASRIEILKGFMSRWNTL